MPAQAQVYRWVDENGKVHYGDRPPASQNAEDISETVNDVNIDNSQIEQKKMEAIFSPETEVERAARENQEQQQRQQQQKRNELCSKARENLRIASEERFTMTDKEGNPIKSTKEEEQAYRDRLHDIIDKNCS